MTGFGPDNVVEGSVDFTDDSFRGNDGINSLGWIIEWDHNGFDILQQSDSTDQGAERLHSELALFVDPGSHVDITIESDGSLTMVSGGRTVGAEPAEDDAG